MLFSLLPKVAKSAVDDGVAGRVLETLRVQPSARMPSDHRSRMPWRDSQGSWLSSPARWIKAS